MQITRLSYFGSENQGLPLRSWFVTCWLWRHIPIVTSLAVPSSCVVTQTPMGTNSGTRRRERKFPLLFVNCDRGRIEIDHLNGLRCRGWYCNPEQHSLCRPARPQAASQRPAQLVLFRIAVPTTPAQTVSWSIPIITCHISWTSLNHWPDHLCWNMLSYSGLPTRFHCPHPRLPGESRMSEHPLFSPVVSQWLCNQMQSAWDVATVRL